MKLRTEQARLAGDNEYFYDMGSLEHDAAAAHALMRAMRQYESEFPLSDASPQDVIQWIEKRADEIMASWGFEQEWAV